MKENSIEKDEEILNNIKAYMQENIDKGWHKFVYNDLGYDEKCVDVINAIEHILSDYKRVLKENNRLEEQVEYDKTHIYTPQTIELNFISKSKVKDKIEELKKKVEELTDDKGYWGGSDLLEQIKVLQELLEKEK